MHTPYSVYSVFKDVQNDVKNKTTKTLDEDAFIRRISSKNQEILKQISDLFNTKFSNINLDEYIRCGFHHFKGFGYDKMFREIVLNEYISRDSRIKRGSDEGLSKVLESLKYINRPLESYINEVVGGERTIVKDYVMNRIGSTIVVYCIWRNLFTPTDIEWGYMNTIQNNFPLFEKNVVKFASLIDLWRRKMKGK